MERFRKPILRRFFTIVFFLSVVSIQTQTLFACNLMGGEPQAKCCCHEHMENGCPMGGGCHTAPGGVSTGCCDISVEVDMQDPAVSSSVETQRVDLLDAAQPPPTILTSTEITLARSDASGRTGFDYHPPPSWLAGTYTYLITQRFRV